MNSITIGFEELSELIKKSENIMIESDNSLYLFYQKHLQGNTSFTRDIYKVISNNEFLTNYYKVSPEPTFYEILLYVYFMPWNLQKEIPHYNHSRNVAAWENWFYKKKKNRKGHFGSIVEKEDGDSYSGSINVSAFIRDNIDTLNATLDSPKTEREFLRDTLNSIVLWSSMTGGDVPYGRYLTSFPLISVLSISKKKSFFLVDLGLELYSILQTIVTDDIPLIIPKDILTQQFVGFSKSSVAAEVEYDAETENVELRSDKYHTVFDVISVASELSDIDNEEERENKITSIVQAIRNENRTFNNITTKDFSALTNILRLFFSPKDRRTVVETTLGELCDTTLSGMVDDKALSEHRKYYILDALDILHKWSSYTFDLGASGRFNVISYVSGNYTNPGHLADAIREGKVTGTFQLEDSDKKSRLLIGDAPAYKDMRSKELSSIPVKLEISSIFKESIERDQMSKQFRNYYQQLSTPNAKTIYSYIDVCRQKEGYPSEMYLSYADIKKAFVSEMRKQQFLKIINTTLDELMLIGAIKSYTYSETSATYKLIF